MKTVKGNMNTRNTNENSATRNGAERGEKQDDRGKREKGRQMDVTLHRLRLALLIDSSLLTAKQSADST